MAETRWTVVTGASSGIGAELAQCFAKIGHNLVLVARRRERLESLARDIETTHDGRVVIVPLDLAEPEAPRRLVDEVAARGITIHTLVNSAGFGLRGRFAEQPIDDQTAMVEVNVMALTKLCRLVLPGLIQRRRGGILNVASTAAYQAGPNMALYYATKAFVLHLSEALHEEAKEHGVVVTALCPGPTESEFAERANLQGSLLFRMGRMSAAKAAQAGVDGYRARHAVVVPGARNKIGSIGATLIPRFIARRVAGRLQA